jgi:hypothetical protein
VDASLPLSLPPCFVPDPLSFIGTWRAICCRVVVPCCPTPARTDTLRSLADIVRWKNAVERSTEEKEWVAIDMRMFPELYLNLPGLTCGLGCAPLHPPSPPTPPPQPTATNDHPLPSAQLARLHGAPGVPVHFVSCGLWAPL